MKRCENGDRCNVKDCPHKYMHEEQLDPENNCYLPCDVVNGFKGSKCFDKS